MSGVRLGDVRIPETMGDTGGATAESASARRGKTFPPLNGSST